MPLNAAPCRPFALAVVACAASAILLAAGCAAGRGHSEPEIASGDPVIELDEPAPAETADDYGEPMLVDGEPLDAEAAGEGSENRRRFRPFERLVADPAHFVPVSGTEVTGETAVAIDVQNASGVVKVIVDDRLERASVWVRPFWANTAEEARPSREVVEAADWGTAEHVSSGPEHSVLRVYGTPHVLGGEYPEPSLEIVVRTPAGDGLQVRNGSGPVDVVNVRGAVTIENGVAGGRGGWVRIRTDHPVDAPVNVVTPHGDVLLVTVAESKGLIRLQAPQGRTVFSVPSGRVTGVRDSSDGYTAVWNGGGNEIVLRSESGDVRILGVTKPSMYTYNEFDFTELDNNLKEMGFADWFRF